MGASARPAVSGRAGSLRGGGVDDATGVGASETMAGRPLLEGAVDQGQATRVQSEQFGGSSGVFLPG